MASRILFCPASGVGTQALVWLEAMVGSGKKATVPFVEVVSLYGKVSVVGIPPLRR